MSSNYRNEEFFSKDESDEFACENYFSNKPFFIMESANISSENENYHKNFQDAGLSSEKNSNVINIHYNYSFLIFF